MRWSLIILLGLVLGACGRLPVQPADVEQRVNDLVAADAYGEALQLLEEQLARTPDEHWQTRQQAVQSRARQFEVQQLREADALARAKSWRQVEELLDLALARYPQSATLVQARQDFLKRRRSELEDISLQLLLLRGQWLARSAPLYAEAETKGATSDWRESLQQFHNDRRQVASDLHRSGQKALHEGDNELATQCLELSAALVPNDAVRAALGTARHRHESERTRSAAAQQQRQQQDNARRNAEMAGQCRQALAADKLRDANSCLQQLDGQAPYSAEVAELRPLIVDAIDRHVRVGIDAGRERYSNGQIEQALQIWQPLLELRPDNLELQTHVERARRVLKKLRQLGG